MPASDPVWLVINALSGWIRPDATEPLCRGVAVEVVGKLLGHTSITPTSDTCAQLKIKDARRALVTADWLTDKDVQL